MAWSEQPQLTERLTAVGRFLKSVCQHWQLGDSYEGWVAAQHREAPRWMPLVKQRLRALTQSLSSRRFGRWQAFAVDGSLVACPRTKANQAAMGDRGKPEGIPQVAITTLLHLDTNLPWDFRVGPGHESERYHLREMLDELPGGALLVADAGFIGYDLCRELMARKQPFLLRVGGNIRLLDSLGYRHEVCGETVYLWPTNRQDKNEPPLRLRLIVLRATGREPIYLVTSVLDATQLSSELAGEIYHARWGIEVSFRTLKQTLTHHTLRSRTPTTCYLELGCYLLGMWLLQLITAREIETGGSDVRECSAARARNCVRRAMRNQRPGRPGRTLRAALRGCVLDRYERRVTKASRGYPRKKQHRPPGPPKIKPPDQRQLLKAQQLTPLELRE